MRCYLALCIASLSGFQFTLFDLATDKDNQILTCRHVNNLPAEDKRVDETRSYTYDSRGNQIEEYNETEGITTAYTYGVTGEMTGLTVSSGDTVTLTQENQYNHEGIRISKTEGGVTRRYYYDNGIVAYTKDGTTVSSANVLSGGGDILGTYRGEDYHVYTKDVQNSVESIQREDGILAAAYHYSDFGETEELTGSSFDNEICYTGAVYDAASSLYYMNARYYDPANGRFISQDTYRGELDDADQWHLYAYCANNPINYVDPSGHELISAIYIGVFLGGIVLTAYTTTETFRKSWNNVAAGIGNVLGYLSSSVKTIANSLAKDIGNSFAKAKKKYKTTEVHHIVAQSATGAKPARKILNYKSVNIKLNSETNLVTLKKGLHKRLHRKSYYDMVNLAVETAYKKKGNKKTNVKKAIESVKTYLKKLNKIAPF